MGTCEYVLEHPAISAAMRNDGRGNAQSDQCVTSRGDEEKGGGGGGVPLPMWALTSALSQMRKLRPVASTWRSRAETPADCVAHVVVAGSAGDASGDGSGWALCSDSSPFYVLSTFLCDKHIGIRLSREQKNGTGSEESRRLR